ncbi:uncharacterized protein LOC119096351 [Pollicipes pollicipes]|uniref:uncharacterized protein LOC119096351 n=1 Tax=Pollicipes pollicipes TaxID=41117 RepID=UPI0018854901|nr:uncharacterized protein LOC119096351 [Pollicipes pollicipes]
MTGFRLLVLCVVIVTVSGQAPPASKQFCLELLRSDEPHKTSEALLACVREVKAAQRDGRKFELSSAVYDSIGQCIAKRIGVLDGFGRVNKEELARRIRASKEITEQQRQFYLSVVPNCDGWNSCLKKHCRL